MKRASMPCAMPDAATPCKDLNNQDTCMRAVSPNKKTAAPLAPSFILSVLPLVRPLLLLLLSLSRRSVNEGNTKALNGAMKILEFLECNSRFWSFWSDSSASNLGRHKISKTSHGCMSYSPSSSSNSP